MIKKYIFLLFLICSISCEKDDICESGTPTTPRLIITFYDNLNPTTEKKLTNLDVNALGSSESLLFDAVSKIELPLKTDANTVAYNFTLDSKNTNPDLKNKDAIQITYSHQDVYISRACGFKTIFELDADPNKAIKRVTDTNNWIKEITIIQNKIHNENEIHVKIFF